MMKKCTNSSCRRVFSTSYYGFECPYCGKRYPRLLECGKGKGVYLISYPPQNKLRVLKLVREMNSKTTTMRLKEAKALVESVPAMANPMRPRMNAGEAVYWVKELRKYDANVVLR